MTISLFLRCMLCKVSSKLGMAALPEKDRKQITDNFHLLYFSLAAAGKTWNNTKWQGVSVLKLPFDLWVYQEIVFEQKPDLIVETGTAAGGSVLFLAQLLDLNNNGEIITIDIEHRDGRPKHPRFQYLTGSSVALDIFTIVLNKAKAARSVLVILDSDHTKNHVLKELELYSPIVTSGSYLIVEDTNVNGHPVFPEHGEGPMEAVQEFLKTDNQFIRDPEREKFLISFNPSGYLKKVK